MRVAKIRRDYFQGNYECRDTENASEAELLEQPALVTYCVFKSSPEHMVLASWRVREREDHKH